MKFAESTYGKRFVSVFGKLDSVRAKAEKINQELASVQADENYFRTKLMAAGATADDISTLEKAGRAHAASVSAKRSVRAKERFSGKGKK